MKLKNVFFAAAISAIALQSCNKSDLSTTTDATTTTETVDMTVTQGAKSTIVLPATASGYRITTNASNSSSSVITTNESGLEVYEYTAPADYSGTDVVEISATETTDTPPQGGCDRKKKNGNSNAQQTRETRVKVNVTVVPNSTTAS